MEKRLGKIPLRIGFGFNEHYVDFGEYDKSPINSEWRIPTGTGIIINHKIKQTLIAEFIVGEVTLHDKLFQILWLDQLFKEIRYYMNYDAHSSFETPVPADGAIFEINLMLAGSGSV